MTSVNVDEYTQRRRDEGFGRIEGIAWFAGTADSINNNQPQHAWGAVFPQCLSLDPDWSKAWPENPNPSSIGSTSIGIGEPR